MPAPTGLSRGTGGGRRGVGRCAAARAQFRDRRQNAAPDRGGGAGIRRAGAPPGLAHREDRSPRPADPDGPARIAARGAVLRGGLHRGHGAGATRAPPARARTIHGMGAASRDLRLPGRFPGAGATQLPVRVPGGPRPVRSAGLVARGRRPSAGGRPLAAIPAGDPAPVVHRPAVRWIACGPLHPERFRRRFPAALRDLHLGHLQPGPRIAGPPHRCGACPVARVRDAAGARRGESFRASVPPVSRSRAVPAAPHPPARRLEMDRTGPVRPGVVAGARPAGRRLSLLAVPGAPQERPRG